MNLFRLMCLVKSSQGSDFPFRARKTSTTHGLPWTITRLPTGSLSSLPQIFWMLPTSPASKLSLMSVKHQLEESKSILRISIILSKYVKMVKCCTRALFFSRYLWPCLLGQPSN